MNDMPWLSKIFGRSDGRRPKRAHAPEFVHRNPPAKLPPRRPVAPSESPANSISQKIPNKFRNTSEAKRLMQAEAEFNAALQQEKLLTREMRGQVHLIGDDLRRAQEELEAAMAAFDAATGEQTLPLPLSPEHMAVFQKAVEKHFGEVASNLNCKLERVSPSLYGFVTSCAIVTVGVYHGHSPSVCVKLRERRAGETLGECDGKDIGLANVVAFVDPSAPPSSSWEHRSYDLELRALAAKLTRYGRSFLLDPNADWSGLRGWLRRKTEKYLSEMPWLSKFRRDT